MNPRKLFAAAAVFLSLSFISAEKFKIDIWKNIPQIKTAPVRLYCSIPENCNGSAVIILPGGSYHHLGYFTEGKSTAKWFNRLGTATFILNYRVAQNNFHYPDMMQDVQRTIWYVRQNADKFGLDKNRLAVIGYSAGGHLSLWSGEASEKENLLEKCGITVSESLKPDFVIAVYPVVSMQDDIYHHWSRKSLFGKNPTQNEKDKLSLELNIPENMSPTYIVVCEDDKVVLPENSFRMKQALDSRNIDSRLAVYPEGGHGFAMLDNAFMKKYHWNDELKTWLTEHGFF